MSFFKGRKEGKKEKEKERTTGMSLSAEEQTYHCVIIGEKKFLASTIKKYWRWAISTKECGQAWAKIYEVAMHLLSNLVEFSFSAIL